MGYPMLRLGLAERTIFKAMRNPALILLLVPFCVACSATQNAALKVQDPRAAATDLYGDLLPEGAIARMGTVRFRHNGDILAMVYSLDGQHLIAGYASGNVMRWEVSTGKGKLLLDLEKEADHLGSMAISSDGRTVAAGWVFGEIELWDIESGKQSAKLQPHPWGYYAIVFSADGKMLASSELDGVIRLSNSTTGDLIRKLQGAKDVGTLAISHDGKTIISDHAEGPIQLWETATGKRLRSIVTDHRNVPIACSPSSDIVASSSLVTGQLWDTRTGKLLRTFESEAGAIAFSRNARTMASAAGSSFDSTIRLWSVDTAKQLREITGLEDHVKLLVFSPDGKTLAAATGGKGAAIRFYNVDTGTSVHDLIGHDRNLESVSFLPDSKTLVTKSGGNALHLWEAATGKHLRMIRTPCDIVGMTSDSKSLITLGTKPTDRMRGAIWDLSTGKKQRDFKLDWDYRHFSLGTFSPDGRRFALMEVQSNGLIHVFDLNTGEILHSLPGRKGGTGCLIFSRAGGLLVSGGGDFFGGTVKLGRIWDVATGAALIEFGKRAYCNVSEVAISADQKTLAYFTNHNKTIYIWELASGMRVFTLQGHERAVMALDFTPDGSTLISLDYMGILRFWNLAERKVLQNVRVRTSGFRSVEAFSVSPDGRWLATTKGTTALVWELPLAQPKARRLTAEDLNRAWSDIRAEDASKAHRAMGLMVAAGNDTVSLLANSLKPVPAKDGERIRKLISQLDNDDVESREKATDQLLKIGLPTELALRKAEKETRSPEQRTRIGAVLRALEGFMPQMSAPLHRIRAVQVLERIGSDEARTVLMSLGTYDGQAALRRLEGLHKQ